MHAVVTDTGFLNLPLKSKGKVRDIYDLGDTLLLIATDRVSAFDVVLPTGIAHKGQVLTQISKFWFEKYADLVANHMITTDVSKMPKPISDYPNELHGRAMLVKKAEVIPVECVVRGYLAGSGWKEYKSNGSVCGIALPKGLLESQQLPEPIFTPASKNDVGHDENISFKVMVEMIGEKLATQLRDISMTLYRNAAEYALQKGIILADTKFEFGLHQGKILLIDECFTPDSSRFWLVSEYKPGQSQASLDKQFIRDWLEATNWNKEPPAPMLPDWVIEGTIQRYLDAYRVLTGRDLLSEE